MADARVRIHIAGFRLELRGPESLVDRSVARLVATSSTALESRRRAPSAAASAAPVYEPPTERFSLYQRQRAQSEVDPADPDRIASYAFYLWNYEKKDVFHEAEVAGCYAADGARAPEDLGPAYGDLLSRRVLAPGERDRTWRLTGKGKAYVRKRLM